MNLNYLVELSCLKFATTFYFINKKWLI